MSAAMKGTWKMKIVHALVLLIVMALATPAPAGELKVASSGPQQVKIELPGEAGSSVTVTLTEGWGRTRDPNKE